MATKVSAYRMIDYDKSSFKTSTTNYTLTSTDWVPYAVNTIALSSASTSSSTLTAIVPNNNFPEGFQVTILRLGLGPVNISGAAGVNIRSSTNSYNLAYQYSVASLVYTGSPNVGWILFGDLI